MCQIFIRKYSHANPFRMCTSHFTTVRITIVYCGYNIKCFCNESFSLSSDYSVLILGAGIAGIRAAQLLSEAGANIQIIEGSDRIGGIWLIFNRYEKEFNYFWNILPYFQLLYILFQGRIKTGQLAGIQLELGATWIYGSDQTNPIFRWNSCSYNNLVISMKGIISRYRAHQFSRAEVACNNCLEVSTLTETHWQ